MSEILARYRKIFNDLKQFTTDGQEYWSARDLMPILGYRKWERFEGSIDRAKIACQNSGFSSEDHFPGSGKMVEIGSGTEREVADYNLTRYACYLVAMNGDPRKPEIAAAQTYFAIKTHEAETGVSFIKSADAPQLPPIPSQREQLETVNLALDLLERTGGADERTEMMFQDYIVNTVLKAGGNTLLLPPADEHYEITISERAMELGHRPTSGQLSSMGKAASRLYVARYGVKPIRRRQLVAGAPRSVNSYTTKDLDILDQAIKQVIG